MQKIKLCGIYIIWDDWDWLGLNLKNSFKWLDEILVIWSDKSNFGESSSKKNSIDIDYLEYQGSNIRYINFEPDLKKSPVENETLKRNSGLHWARKTNCTHFLMMDADEFYTKEDIQKGKQQIGDYNGLICSIQTYFKTPLLTIGNEKTLVPFIHKIRNDLEFKMNKNYPFAWSPNIRIDPTRQMNLNSDIGWSNIIMHHYSWIRKDIKKKIRNSTARFNIERSTILQDYLQAKEGYFCQFYGKRLEACPNIFDLPEIIDEKLSN